ncbi:D-2-hydroxyacid dehydrogenase [Rhizobium leguminosarum]|uniref:D-2-hydroxyacid dehydrogenase n=1 Tax=Rhizobium leguminosarum TaxID=384 RepID=UPI001441C8D3|nr:D-2-hydroxyacid dehydrogenase [Rhizobium leguminosarum]MBY5836290.1 D-2-hydroxyacid dehydrogenase [Rhizobium leguminosarum]NKM79018.1 D-2-hydroxyacid dehydrogenase [Rhizobium leguminosarum bv. viciae]QSZ08608.1 D-2-hydroxyacid dehydrogenase [Rhizobium leguminosarum]
MASNAFEEWATVPRIYIENVRGRDPAYEVTADAVLRNLHPVCKPAAVTCRFSDDRDLDAFRQAEILIAGRLDTAFIANEAHSVKIIQCTSAGVEDYAPFDWLGPTTTLTNASGVHAEKVGEFALMAALMLHSGVPAIATNQRRHLWKRQLGGMASGSRVLIYGVGALGGAVAERLQAVGFHVVGIRRNGQAHTAVDRMTTPDKFHQELSRTDILVLACPLTPETRGLVGGIELSMLPSGASLLNIARAGVLDHRALALSLESGRLSGAILDVFEQEPLPENSELWDVPNLMIFPHVSADAPIGYVDRCLAILAENLKRAKAGQSLRNVVDPLRGY